MGTAGVREEVEDLGDGKEKMNDLPPGSQRDGLYRYGESEAHNHKRGKKIEAEAQILKLKLDLSS